MLRYTQERKDYALSLMSPPKNISVAEYCRHKGLYVEQIARWRLACMQANRGGASGWLAGADVTLPLWTASALIEAGLLIALLRQRQWTPVAKAVEA